MPVWSLQNRVTKSIQCLSYKGSWLAILFLCCASFIGLSSCSQKPDKEIRISTLLWPGYEPLVLADKLGYFKDENIRIIDYLSNTDAITAFENFNLAAGAFTLDEALHMLADGVDLKIVLIMDTSHGGDVIMANPEIKSIQDLKGQPIAVESSAVGAFFLKRALQFNDMKISDVNVVSTSAIEQVRKFKANEVKAAVSFNPYQTQLAKLGKKVIFSSKQIPNEILDVLVVRSEVLETQPDKVKLIIDSWFKALAFQQQNPRKAAEFAVKRYKMTIDEYLQSQSGIQFTDLATNRKLLTPNSSPLLALEPVLLETLESLALIEKRPASAETVLDSHLSPDFLPQ